MEFVPLKMAFCAGRRTLALTLQLVSLGREHTMARLLDRTAELIVPGACKDMVDVIMLCALCAVARPLKPSSQHNRRL